MILAETPPQPSSPHEQVNTATLPVCEMSRRMPEEVPTRQAADREEPQPIGIGQQYPKVDVADLDTHSLHRFVDGVARLRRKETNAREVRRDASPSA